MSHPRQLQPRAHWQQAHNRISINRHLGPTCRATSSETRFNKKLTAQSPKKLQAAPRKIEAPRGNLGLARTEFPFWEVVCGLYKRRTEAIGYVAVTTGRTSRVSPGGRETHRNKQKGTTACGEGAEPAGEAAREEPKRVQGTRGLSYLCRDLALCNRCTHEVDEGGFRPAL